MACRIRWYPVGFAAMAIVVSLFFAWLLAGYLRGFDVPIIAATSIGLLVVPAALVVAALLAALFIGVTAVFGAMLATMGMNACQRPL